LKNSRFKISLVLLIYSIFVFNTAVKFDQFSFLRRPKSKTNQKKKTLFFVFLFVFFLSLVASFFANVKEGLSGNKDGGKKDAPQEYDVTGGAAGIDPSRSYILY
jgi:hypothetical protein